jgi:hypothetical protein
MVDWIIPLVVGALIAGAVLVVPFLMRSKSGSLSQQTNNFNSDALSPNPTTMPPDQNIVSEPKNWSRVLEWRALSILGQIALGLIIGLIVLMVIMPFMIRSFMPTVP